MVRRKNINELERFETLKRKIKFRKMEKYTRVDKPGQDTGDNEVTFSTVLR